MNTEIYEDDVAQQTSLVVVPQAQALQVVDQPSLTRANDLLLDIKLAQKRFGDEFDFGIKQAHEHHKFLVAQKKRWVEPLERAEAILKPRIAQYLQDEDARRLQVEREAQLIKQTVEKEAEDTADVAREFIQEGRLDEADEVVAMTAEKIEQIQAAAPVIPDKPIAVGATLREVWDFEIVDVNLIPRKFMVPDEKAIRKVVQGLHSQADIPGVRAFSTKTISSKVNGR